MSSGAQPSRKSSAPALGHGRVVAAQHEDRVGLRQRVAELMVFPDLLDERPYRGVMASLRRIVYSHDRQAVVPLMPTVWIAVASTRGSDRSELEEPPHALHARVRARGIGHRAVPHDVVDDDEAAAAATV